MMRRTMSTALLVALLAPAPAFAFDLDGLMKGAENAAQSAGDLTKAAQAFMLTQEDEVAIGQQMYGEIVQETPRHPDEALQKYVSQVGARLAIASKAPYRFYFTVIQSDEVNAFAAPGGFIFVTTAALKLMTTEAQLAGVLGHEVAHVAQHHGIEAIKKAMLAQGVANTALRNNQSQLAKMGADFGTKLILKGFDRAAESESDDLGQKWAAEAGYDPKGIEEFLNQLAQMGDGPVWLMPVSSHPRSDDRVKALAAKRPAASKAFVGADRYQKNVLAVLGAAGGKR